MLRHSTNLPRRSVRCCIIRWLMRSKKIASQRKSKPYAMPLQTHGPWPLGRVLHAMASTDGIKMLETGVPAHPQYANTEVYNTSMPNNILGEHGASQDEKKNRKYADAHRTEQEISAHAAITQLSTRHMHQLYMGPHTLQPLHCFTCTGSTLYLVQHRVKLWEFFDVLLQRR